MRKLLSRAFGITLLLVIVGGLSAAQRLAYVSSQSMTPSGSTAIAVPSNSDYALMTIRTAGVHISWTGGTATTANTYYAPGLYVWDNQRDLLNGATIITSSDGTAVVTIDYFSKR